MGNGTKFLSIVLFLAFAAPAFADPTPATNGVVFLIRPLDGTFDFVGSGGDDDDDYFPEYSLTFEGGCDSGCDFAIGDTYQVIRYAEVSNGLFPDVDFDVAPGFSAPGFGPGSEYILLGTMDGSIHLGVGTDDGPGQFIPDAFEQAVIESLIQFGSLGGGNLAGPLGSDEFFSADEFWQFFEDNNDSFSPEEYADFINNSAGFINFLAIQTLGEDDFGGAMGDDGFLGFTTGITVGGFQTFVGSDGEGTGGFTPAPEPAGILLALMAAASVFGVHRSTIYRWLQSHGTAEPQQRRG